MTKEERTSLAHAKAQAIVQQLKASNESAARSGAPVVDPSNYHGLASELTRKLLREA